MTRLDRGEIVRGVSFFAPRKGQRLGLVGESGSGKSVTALAIMRLLRPVMSVLGGQVMLEGEDLLSLSRREMTAVRGGKIAMIYQDPLSALNPVLSIGSQIVEAVQLHSSVSKTAARVRAIDLLAEVGIVEPARRFAAYPHEFSGGMRQRALIAMALSGDPAVLIADEPTTALDVTSQARIMDILARLSELRSMSVLFITHDLGVAAGFCDSVRGDAYAGPYRRASKRVIFVRATGTPVLCGSAGGGVRSVDPPRRAHRRNCWITAGCRRVRGRM